MENNLKLNKVITKWSAQHYHSADGIPYIGYAYKNTKRVFTATGFFADGLIYGTLAGILLADQILLQQNPLLDIYDSRRHNLSGSIGFLLKENMNVLKEYLFDLPKPFSKLDNLKPGEGCIIQQQQEKLAVSCNKNGELTAVSAICTHMKGIVDWNNAEKTWDCPCHGSRFTANGQVIEGPAFSPLEKKTLVRK